jgi:diguanylate cyclase (GGDEF)-like protein
VAATGAFQQEQLSVRQAVSPAFAVRAFRATGSTELDRLRAASGLDYLLVVRHGRVAEASIDLPVPFPRDGEAIAGGALRFVAAERRVVVRPVADSSVTGGRLWDPHLPPALQVRSVLVVNGHPTGDVGVPFSATRRPVSAGDGRLVCLCRGGTGASGLALFTSAPAEGLWAWLRWPRVGLVILAIATLVVLAYVLAWLLSRPLSRLASEVSAVARGETTTTPAVDEADGREIYQVATGLQAVTKELRGSRGALERARGKLAATERMTLTDPLTDVWNRRYLERALREQIKRYGRFQSPFALLLIDIDRFKGINDVHGHLAADALLQGVARAIGASIRSDIDVLARFGGDEFAVVLPESDAGGALAAAEKIRRLVAESPFESDSAEISITVSIGVAVCPQDGLTPEQILSAADAAMYEAKAAGRNRTFSASGGFAGPRRSGES